MATATKIEVEERRAQRPERIGERFRQHLSCKRHEPAASAVRDDVQPNTRHHDPLTLWGAALVAEILDHVMARFNLGDADRAHLAKRLEEGGDHALILGFYDRYKVVLAGDHGFSEKRYVVFRRVLWLHVIGETLGHLFIARRTPLGVMPVVN